ncbi:hypothetical protein [Flavobacterium sp.]|uniref:hypothetical protein n=1 Tax=Flavobacterium sp. TaxID=239 RepID=UPI00286DAA8D|nr:hypothetical protein [Flavobacterium sp.]
MKKLNLLFIGILLISIVSCNSDEPITATTPIVNNETTSANAEITFTTIKISGKIIPNGNNEVSSRGVCWSTNPNPTINDGRKNEISNTFSSTISDLTVNTKYYFRIFAITNSGISYGENQAFNTLSLSDTNWQFTSVYSPDNYIIESTINFNGDNTTKFDEMGSGQGYFITYGTWALNGNTLTYIWEGNNPNNSTYVYTGTLSGMTITGNFTHPTTPGTWRAIQL